MKLDVITPFPEMIESVSGSSIARIAAEKGLAHIYARDLRQWSENRHRKVDDYPFGGGKGMILSPQPLASAISELKLGSPEPRVIFPTPDGRRFCQEDAEDLSACDHLIFVCGHYKGIDQRIRDHYITDEISIGDYVLTGGEIAALVIIDAVVRLIPGVLGAMESADGDSFTFPLLDAPWYTRPEEFEGLTVPEVLLSGHHARIEDWRMEQREKKTKERRPDIYEEYKKYHPLKRSPKK